jgi:hypothetical protein
MSRAGQGFGDTQPVCSIAMPQQSTELHPGDFFQAAAVTCVALLRLLPRRPSMPTDTGPSIVIRCTMRHWSP